MVAKKDSQASITTHQVSQVQRDDLLERKVEKKIHIKSLCQLIVTTWFQSPWGPRSAIFGPDDIHPIY